MIRETVSIQKESERAQAKEAPAKMEMPVRNIRL
jgi:hypothetical protein